ncbi:MAG: hypothetical protein HY930_03675 [Euryarchaeota archaeon]|nr:hypothetical protein [Euryarchaeota archaeon]
MLLVVRFPKKQWKKVNISRFLSKFEKIRASTIIDVPEKELDHVLRVLSRNDCDVKLVKPVKKEVEEKIVSELLKLCQKVRMNEAQPKEIEKFAADAIAKFSLEKLDEEAADILHLGIEFGKEPNLLTLSEIEKECKDFLFG